MPTSENHEDIEKDRLKRSVNMAIELGTSKKLSPFEVLMGFQPEMPVEKLLFPTRKTWIGWEAETHFSQLVLHLREQRGRHAKNLVKIADADIERAIKDPKRYAESKVFYSRQKIEKRELKYAFEKDKKETFISQDNHPETRARSCT